MQKSPAGTRNPRRNRLRGACHLFCWQQPFNSALFNLLVAATATAERGEQARRSLAQLHEPAGLPLAESDLLPRLLPLRVHMLLLAQPLRE